VSGARDGVALVTGGGQGIGAAIAGRLATDGRAVAVVDLNEQAAEEAAAAIREKGGRAVAVPADVTDRVHDQAAVNRAVAEFGGLHILVNNAGVTRDNLLFKMTAADWRQ
jgi:3-oxoacyl-[acyl-carrier protein] reductase